MGSGWGLTNRPAPTVHGKLPFTRGASGTKQIVGAAIYAGCFIARPPFSQEDLLTSQRADLDYGTSFAARFRGAAINPLMEDAVVLQSYPASFFLDGGKQEQELQIGNAVPPRVAQAVFESLWT
jgi:site-specific DNA-cytosine methylase